MRKDRSKSIRITNLQ